MKKGLFSPDGMIHTRRQERRSKHKERKKSTVDIDVCLNCNKEKCSGTVECIKRSKNNESKQELNNDN